jgi:hypothetical protein
VKQIADEIAYRYEGGRNLLLIGKRFGGRTAA